MGRDLVRWLVRLSKGEGIAARCVDELIYAARRASAFVLSDEMHARLYSRFRLGTWVDLVQPRTFNEKIQWLRLHHRYDQLVQIVDKYAVREFVAERVGSELLIPMHGIYADVDEIDLGRLPQSFVLKPTHGSGWVILCKDKTQFEWPAARRRLGRWLKRNYYYHAREWPYKHVPPRVICEEFLTDDDGQPPLDYKFFCFGGEPRYVQVDLDRFRDHSRNFYDMEWRRMDLELLYRSSPGDVQRPDQLERMIEVSKSLAQGFPFVRVDLYVVRSKVYFGELTLYPENGIGTFTPESYDMIFGEQIELPDVTASEAQVFS